jgi:hypothetical protein
MVNVTHIGRVGALAVALGIGAGLTATPWAASANPSDSASPSSSNSPSGSSSAPTASSPSSSSSATGDTTPAAHPTPGAAGPPNPDCASCVEQFNIAVGTPGEYQRVFHQDKLGRDVSYFARIPKQDCPF